MDLAIMSWDCNITTSLVLCVAKKLFLSQVSHIFIWPAEYVGGGVYLVVHPENIKMGKFQLHITSNEVDKKVQVVYENYSVKCRKSFFLLSYVIYRGVGRVKFTSCTEKSK